MAAPLAYTTDSHISRFQASLPRYTEVTNEYFGLENTLFTSFATFVRWRFLIGKESKTSTFLIDFALRGRDLASQSKINLNKLRIFKSVCCISSEKSYKSAQGHG